VTEKFKYMVGLSDKMPVTLIPVEVPCQAADYCETLTDQAMWYKSATHVWFLKPMCAACITESGHQPLHGDRCAHCQMTECICVNEEKIMSGIGKYKFIVFDADGTLVTTKSEQTFRQTPDDWKWLPGRLHALKLLRHRGVKLAICTNQGGVAFGYMQAQDILAELTRMIKEVDIPAGGLYVCYTHPKAKIEQYRDEEDNRRKPGPGMILEAMSDFSVEPEGTLFVGDRPEDEAAAKAAGVDFQSSDSFFEEFFKV